MSLLNRLHHSFRVDASEPASSQDDLAALRVFAKKNHIEIPADYISIIEEATEVEILVKDTEYIRIWSANGVREMNTAYEVQANISGGLAIGDNEGGDALVVIHGHGLSGLYRVPFGAMDASEVTYVSSGLTELLVSGVGVATLFG